MGKLNEPHPATLAAAATAVTKPASGEAALTAAALTGAAVTDRLQPELGVHATEMPETAPRETEPIEIGTPVRTGSEGVAATGAARAPTGTQADLLAAAGLALRTTLDQRLAPGLYLVATPIGNLADITLRALATLAQADLILCEDTRHSLKLLNHYAITSHLEPYHEHNAHLIRPRVLKALGKRQRVALISDAGTPLISDPGYKLVREALDRGYTVSALPGPSAALAALTMSGLPTDSFFFAGFLPPKSGARQSRLQTLADVPGTLIVFEAPTRVAATLADIAAVLGDRPVGLARELTKVHETVRLGTATAMAAALADADLRGECVLLVGAATAPDVTDAVIADELRAALASASINAAARHVADLLGVAKNRVYAIALTLPRGDPTKSGAP